MPRVGQVVGKFTTVTIRKKTHKFKETIDRGPEKWPIQVTECGLEAQSCGMASGHGEELFLAFSRNSFCQICYPFYYRHQKEKLKK